MGSRLIVPHTTSEGVDGVWLLEMVIGGRPERYATRDVTVTVASGGSEVNVFRSGLSNPNTSPNGAPDRLALAVDDLTTDWSDIVAGGEDIDWSPARLWWWYPGQSLDQALSVMEGVVTSVQYGDPESTTMLSFDLDQKATEDATQFPDATAVVDTTTWTVDTTHDIDDQAVGQYYPTVIGYPGSGDDSATAVSATAGADIAVPALAVQVDPAPETGTPYDTLRILVSEGEVDADKVTIWDIAEDGITQVLHEDLDIATTTDLLGRTVSYAIMPQGSSLTPTVGREWYSGFNNETAWGGGIRFDGELLRDLGDVLTWALSKSGGTVDLQRQRGEAAALSSFKIDTYINTPIDPEKWIESQLVPLFPIRRMRSAAGLWYRYVNWSATANDAVMRVDVDNGQATTVSPVTTLRGALFNTFTIEYKFGPHGGRYRSRRILAPEHEAFPLFTGTDGRVTGSSICRASRERYGLRVKPPVQTKLTWSDATASAILNFWALRDAFPLYGITIRSTGLDRLLPGDPIVINDTARGLSERVAIVGDVNVGGPTQTADLVLLPRITRAAA